MLDCGVYYYNSVVILAEEFPCPTTWDGWSCFPSAAAGSMVELPCSSQAYSTTASVCTCRYYYKILTILFVTDVL